MQAEEYTPEADVVPALKRPTAQAVHADCPDVLVYSPLGHSSQTVAAALLYSPATHAVHPLEPDDGSCQPATQSAHEVAAAALAYVPGPHSVHAAVPWPGA